MFDKSKFALMKSTVVFVNAGRGGTVNHDDLAHAFNERQIFAAGLDVTDRETLSTDHALLMYPYCFITPHVGTATKMTRDNLVQIAMKNVQAPFHGKPHLREIVV